MCDQVRTHWDWVTRLRTPFGRAFIWRELHFLGRPPCREGTDNTIFQPQLIDGLEGDLMGLGSLGAQRTKARPTRSQLKQSVATEWPAALRKSQCSHQIRLRAAREADKEALSKQ